jgi:hypothetical protein
MENRLAERIRQENFKIFLTGIFFKRGTENGGDWIFITFVFGLKMGVGVEKKSKN